MSSLSPRCRSSRQMPPTSPVSNTRCTVRPEVVRYVPQAPRSTGHKWLLPCSAARSIGGRPVRAATTAPALRQQRDQRRWYVVRCSASSTSELQNGATTSNEADNTEATRSKGVFRKLLCANRGEIAIRVFRAAAELDIKSVAIYSNPDRLALHRYKSDESYCVGTEGANGVAGYLDVENVIAVAKANGVDAIHPGYGFLSENAGFARRCAEEGIVFVGPPPEILEQLGDKTQARIIAQACGVPVVPGTDEALSSAEEAKAFARHAGYPVIMKAAMGGGGRGMRVVQSEEDMENAFDQASREALGAFGDGRMFIEKYVLEPRHIEIQILADSYGNVIHLHERDCSVQRRHQKVVEIAPAVGLAEEVRQKLFADAIKIAKHVGYRNAGTVEFMVAPDGSHYFLEVNPRVQVEHTITEQVTGIDIVQSQIYIASGKSLADLGMESQEKVEVRGYAIQGRVTSEDPEKNFQPDTGRIEAFRVPGGMGIRLDGHITVGSSISPYFDSLLVKVITHAHSFEVACKKMERALNEMSIRGLKTNIPYLLNVLSHPEFLSGRATTYFIGKYPELMRSDPRLEVNPHKILGFLAEGKVNGFSHPGAVGPPPAAREPIIPQLPDGVQVTQADGLRDILLNQGQEAFAKYVREYNGVLITDTTWRDAHQSLLATRMRTLDLANSAPFTAQALKNCFSLEMWGGATFDVSMRFLHECPWERLAILREKVPNIPFQMLLRGANAVGYTTYADNVVQKFVNLARQEGVDVFRVFDSLNYLDNLKFGIDAVHDADGLVEATVCYTGDVSNPNKSKYSIDYYMQLTSDLVDAGIHTLAIKDMAGLLKPPAAHLLVSELRSEFPDLPIHVHTHDTAGAGVASMLAAAEAGADVVDVAIDAMSGVTSQPSMGAVIASLEASGLNTGIEMEDVMTMNAYWEDVRGVYSPFESGLKSGAADVYEHEMPGGQYTNLKFQAASLGLANSWRDVKKSYAAANRVLGDIIKVTPSSKVVGDLAQFMVQNELDEVSVVEQAEVLSFPSSVVEFLQGKIGQPVGGFPEPFRSRVLKGAEVIEGRPGASLPKENLKELKIKLIEKYGDDLISDKEVLSAALYPKVFEGFMEMKQKYGMLRALPTRSFLSPLAVDSEILISLRENSDDSIILKAVGELKANGKREVFFEVNGIPRSIEVNDLNISDASGEVAPAMAEKADVNQVGSVGAPMAGEVIDIKVEPGQEVEAGTQLVVMSAMKMETVVSAPCSGHLRHVAVAVGDKVAAGDLLVDIEP